MTIYRKLLKVKSVGSRKTGNLQPAISDTIPSGLNYVVHEYNESKGWCIVEVWCSDHEALRVEHRKDMADLEALLSSENVIEEVKQKHPLSPKILGTLSITASPRVEKEDSKLKTITVKGKVLKYLRKGKDRVHGDFSTHDVYVLDEG